MSLADLVDAAAAERAHVAAHSTRDACPVPLPEPLAPMRVLTVRQPWAWAIVAGAGRLPGAKTTENRSTAARKWRYRGETWIHSATTFSERGLRDRRVIDLMQRWWRSHATEPWLIRGAVLGGVDLVNIHAADHCCEPWGEQSYVEGDGTPRSDLAHLQLDRPWRLLEPPTARGLLGLWRPSMQLVADVHAELFAERVVR